MRRSLRSQRFIDRRIGQVERAAARKAGTPALPADPAAAPPLFLPYQQRWMNDTAKTRVCQKGRRVGLDYCEAFDLVADRMMGFTNLDVWYVSHTEDAGREFMEYVRTWVKVWGRVVQIVEGTDPLDAAGVKVMSVKLPATTVRGLTREPRITALTSNPRAFRGKGGDIRISELAFHAEAEALWNAAVSCTTWGGTLAAWSTHNGEESFFNRLVQMGLRRAAGRARPGDVDLSLHTVTLPQAIDDGLVERINLVSGQQHTRESFLAEVRAKYADHAACEEENLCKPRGEAGSYFPYELLRPCVRAGLPGIVSDVGAFCKALDLVARDADSVYAGCDVGRKSDRFAIAAITRRGGMFRVGPILSWHRRDFGSMKSAIISVMNRQFLSRSGRLRRMVIDNAGLGMQMAEEMESVFRTRVEGVNTGTAAVREDLWTRGRKMVEERTVALPDDLSLLSQINGVRKVVTAGKHDRFDVERNADGHADEATGVMLGLHGADRPSVEPYGARINGGLV